jgi:hypothetical protein
LEIRSKVSSGRSEVKEEPENEEVDSDEEDGRKEAELLVWL